MKEKLKKMSNAELKSRLDELRSIGENPETRSAEELEQLAEERQLIDEVLNERRADAAREQRAAHVAETHHVQALFGPGQTTHKRLIPRLHIGKGGVQGHALYLFRVSDRNQPVHALWPGQILLRKHGKEGAAGEGFPLNKVLPEAHWRFLRMRSKVSMSSDT